MTDVQLNETEVQACYYGLAHFMRQQRIRQRPVPRSVELLYRRIDAAIRTPVSDSGHQISAVPTQSDVWITAREAADILGVSKRQAQRLHADLDGQLIGGRWLFKRETVQEYAHERTSGRGGATAR
ncbi:helix-turn-helix domain-containing protein [Mycobacterium sp. pW045]|uniref:helix-turn-helix domain-containing protein n=1 Tax=Mycobacterium sp. pW045 TaxID=3238984 RepID=UPI00351BBDFE